MESTSPRLVRFVALVLFLSFGYLYLNHHYDETYADGKNLMWTLHHQVKAGKLDKGTASHYLPPLLQYLWVRGIAKTGWWKIPHSHPYVSDFLTLTMRVTALHALIGALTLVFVFLIGFRLSERVELSVLVTCGLGFSANYWIFSTCTEDVLLTTFFGVFGLWLILPEQKDKPDGLLWRFLLTAVMGALMTLSQLTSAAFVPLLYVGWCLYSLPCWLKKEGHRTRLRWHSLLGLGLLWGCLTLGLFLLPMPHLWPELYKVFVGSIVKLATGSKVEGGIYASNAARTFNMWILAGPSFFFDWSPPYDDQSYGKISNFFRTGWPGVLGFVCSLVFLLGFLLSLLRIHWDLFWTRSWEQFRKLGFWWLLGIWWLGGLASVFVVKLAYDPEFWVPPMAGGFPVLLYLLCRSRSRLTWLFSGSLVLLLALSVTQSGAFMLRAPTHKRLKAAINETHNAIRLKEKTRKHDILFAVPEHWSYFLEEITARQRRTLTLNKTKPERWLQLRREALQGKRRVWVMKSHWNAKGQLAFPKLKQHWLRLFRHFGLARTADGSLVELRLTKGFHWILLAPRPLPDKTK